MLLMFLRNFIFIFIDIQFFIQFHIYHNEKEKCLYNVIVQTIHSPI